MESSQAPAEELADLGILLVHGIGEQGQGETLTQMGEPILEWIGNWLAIGLDNGIRGASLVTDAALLPPLLAAGEPAHASVVVGSQKQPKVGSQKQPKGTDLNGEAWIFAEAWWAPQVLRPPLGEFSAWLLTCGPWITLFHLNQAWLCGKWATWLKVAIGIPVTLLWMILSMLNNAVLLVVYLLALIPIEQVRTTFSRLLRALSGVVGDAYVKIRHPFQRHAMEEATLQAMAWLRPRCKRLAVVAHSQGAAIAYGTLERADAPQVDLFVTVGSGMVKLSALRYLQAQAASERVAAAIGPPFLMLAAAAALRSRQLGLTGLGPRVFGPLLLGVVGAVFVGVAWKSVRDALKDLRGRSLVVDKQTGLVWCDIVATHDPVPQGNMTKFFNLPGGTEPVEVPVLASIWKDHTNYWRVAACFMPELVRRLARCSGNRAIPPFGDGDKRFTEAKERHDSALRVLKASQWIHWAAMLVLPLLFARDGLTATARGVREEVTGRFPSVDGYLDLAERGLESAVELSKTIFDGLFSGVVELIGVMVGRSARGAIEWLGAAVALALVCHLWQKVVFAAWRNWSGDRNAEALRAKDASLRTEWTFASVNEWLVTTGMLVLFLSIPSALSLAWTFRPSWISEKNAYWSLGALVAQLLGLGIILGIAEDIRKKFVAARLAYKEGGLVLALKRFAEK